jgi:phosphoribosylanthranilate isomerase
MIPIKICGLRDPANIQEVAALGPDFVGFIFYPKSARWVGSDFDPSALERVPVSVKKIGVFVNESPEAILEIANKFSLEGVQLHGHETPAQAAVLKAEGLLVFKAFGLKPGFDPKQLTQFEDACTHFLFDTATPLHGGSGQRFDWALLDNLTIRLPSFLSGGINLENLDEALATANKYGLGLDVNSGIELSPGLKDIHKAAELIQRVRAFSPPSFQPIPATYHA